VRQSDIKGTA